MYIYILNTQLICQYYYINIMVFLNHIVFLTISDKTWATGEGKGKPLQYSCLENPMNNKKAKRQDTESELPWSVGAQYATRNKWSNNSRKNEETEQKQKQHAVVDVTGDGNKSDAVNSNIAQELGILGP